MSNKINQQKSSKDNHNDRAYYRLMNHIAINYDFLPKHLRNTYCWRINMEVCPKQGYQNKSLPHLTILSTNVPHNLGICKGDSILLIASGKSAVKDNIGVYAQYIAVTNIERCKLYDNDVHDYHIKYRNKAKKSQWRIMVRHIKNLCIDRNRCKDLIQTAVPQEITNKFPPFPGNISN